MTDNSRVPRGELLCLRLLAAIGLGILGWSRVEMARFRGTAKGAFDLPMWAGMLGVAASVTFVACLAERAWLWEKSEVAVFETLALGLLPVVSFPCCLW
jgi:hypothetical protein